MSLVSSNCTMSFYHFFFDFSQAQAVAQSLSARGGGVGGGAGDAGALLSPCPGQKAQTRGHVGQLSGLQDVDARGVARQHERGGGGPRGELRGAEERLPGGSSFSSLTHFFLFSFLNHGCLHDRTYFTAEHLKMLK